MRDYDHKNTRGNHESTIGELQEKGVGKYLHAKLFHGARGLLHHLQLRMLLALLVVLVLEEPIQSSAAGAGGLASGLGEVGTQELLHGHVEHDLVQRGDEEVPVGLGPALTPVLIVPGKEKIRTRKYTNSRTSKKDDVLGDQDRIQFQVEKPCRRTGGVGVEASTRESIGEARGHHGRSNQGHGHDHTRKRPRV